MNDSIKHNILSKDVNHVIKILADKLSEHDIKLTEHTSTYLIFTLNKKGALEFALRINRENKREIALIIICGVELEYGQIDYSYQTGKYVSNHYNEFNSLLEATFDQSLSIDTHTHRWAKHTKSLKWPDNKTMDEFAEECYIAVNQILSNCKTT